jgi:hypothetical protein
LRQEGRVAGVHIEIEIPPFLVVDRLDAERARSRGLAVLDAAGVILLVLHRGALLHDLSELIAGSVVDDLDGVAGNVFPTVLIFTKRKR